MHRSWSKVLACSLIVFSAALIALAQTKSGPKYDKANEVKFKGTVTEVREAAGTDPVIVLVKIGAGNIATVQLGPHDYLKEIDCWLKAGDQVEVTGAKVADSADQIIAREVVFGNNTMLLRDDKGTPIWELWKPTKG